MYHDHAGPPDRPPPLVPVLGAEAVSVCELFFLADEPTGNLDAGSGAQVLDLYRRAHEERGITVVVVTHDREVAAATPREAGLRDGAILWNGPPLLADRRDGGVGRAALVRSRARDEGARVARHGLLLRVWRAWRALSAARRPLEVGELARVAGGGASVRTVRRDVAALRALGLPIKTERRGRTFVYAVFGDGPPLRADRDAALALALALELLRPFEGTDLGDALDHVVRRLEADLPAAALERSTRLARRLVVRRSGAPTYAGARAVLAAIGEALERGRVVALDYAPLDKPAGARRFHAWRLVHGPRGLYVVGFDEKSRATRTLRVERVRSARVLEEPARLEDVDAAEYVGGGVGVFSPEHPPLEFRIRLFSERVARLLAENPWHETQRIEPEGEGTFSMTLTLRSSRELLSRVVALGGQAEVIEPEGFRAEVARALRAGAGRYDRGPRMAEVDGRVGGTARRAARGQGGSSTRRHDA